MELELKHLAPYLPYKLMISVFEKKPIVMIASGSSSSNWVGIGAVVKWAENCKPLLRPLSDLLKEIEHDGDSVYVPNYLQDETEWTIDNIMGFCARGSLLLNIPYYVAEKLISWHFDVFGLIDAGLAITKKD